jgi:hypothetical protein
MSSEASSIMALADDRMIRPSLSSAGATRQAGGG